MSKVKITIRARALFCLMTVVTFSDKHYTQTHLSKENIKALRSNNITTAEHNVRIPLIKEILVTYNLKLHINCLTFTTFGESGCKIDILR
jgi:hypothetical protein